MHDNKIGESGATSLSEALNVNSSLTELNSLGIYIGDSGRKAIADASESNITLTDVIL